MSLRVLIVDDALFMRRCIAKLIEEKGWKVAGEACSGREAIALYPTLKPDVVTMDITMPDGDGLAAARAIIADDPGARIVMCSAVGQQDMLVAAVKAGAKEFIVKPFRKERVIAAIEAVLTK
ncbi:MAG TPA: response regulator [Pantanalinema sp.]